MNLRLIPWAFEFPARGKNPMNAHLSIQQIENFRARSLDLPELTLAAEHISDCEMCHALFLQTAKRDRVAVPAGIDFSAESWFKDAHLEYEELIGLVENTLRGKDREIANLHLSICKFCREDLDSLRSFVKQVEHDLEAQPQREKQSGWRWWPWPALDWRWSSAAALTAIAIALVVIFWKRPDPIRPLPTDPSPAPSMIAAASPTPILPPSPSASIQTTDESLIAANLERPAVLKDLFVKTSTQRGIGEGTKSFKLLSPARTVIEEARPTFRWEPLPGAESYQVQLVATGSREFTASERLSAEMTQWTPAQPLKRGVVYKWMVTAVIKGEEIVSPAPTEPEIRFGLLDQQKLRELQALRKTNPSHIALGSFYARAGMLTEAEREFQVYQTDNPQSPLADKLIRRLRSWRE